MPKPADYPEVVWELLALLSRRNFVFRYEVPTELEAALAIARAEQPPLCKLFDTGIIDPIELGADPSGEDVVVNLPQLGVRLTHDGAAALAWHEHALRSDESATEKEEWSEAKSPDSPTDVPQYVTRDQIAAFVKRHKDTVADWFNNDPDSPPPAVEGGGGKPHEYIWNDVLREWLEKKTGREMPLRFSEFR